MTEIIQTTTQLCSFYMLERLYSKSFKPGADVQARFQRVRGTRNQIADIHWVIEKTRAFQKNICFCFSDTEASVWITTNGGQFLKRWGFQTTLPVSWETGMWIKKQQLEKDTEQWTGSKLGKDCDKAVWRHCDYSTHMQSTSCEMPGRMMHKLDLHSATPSEVS